MATPLHHIKGQIKASAAGCELVGSLAIGIGFDRFAADRLSEGLLGLIAYLHRVAARRIAPASPCRRPVIDIQCRRGSLRKLAAVWRKLAVNIEDMGGAGDAWRAKQARARPPVAVDAHLATGCIAVWLGWRAWHALV